MKVLKPSADDSMREMLEREMVIGRALYRGMGEQSSDDGELSDLTPSPLTSSGGSIRSPFTRSSALSLSIASLQDPLPFLAICSSRLQSVRNQSAESYLVSNGLVPSPPPWHRAIFPPVPPS